jgi:cell division protein FtsN
MSRDMKSKRAPARKKSAGGTLIGLFIGLVLGIVGAAAVVWYINKMPAPFKPQAPAEQGKPGGAPAAPVPLPGKPGDPVPEKRFQFYDILPGKAEAKVDPATTTEKSAEAKDGKEAAKDGAKETIYLQAGSFQSPGDADNQKARLALLGMEASIQQVMLQDKVWYRVRLGPFNKVDDVNRVRSELAKQGIEAAVAKRD